MIASVYHMLAGDTEGGSALALNDSHTVGEWAARKQESKKTRRKETRNTITRDYSLN